MGGGVGSGAARGGEGRLSWEGRGGCEARQTRFSAAAAHGDYASALRRGYRRQRRRCVALRRYNTLRYLGHTHMTLAWAATYAAAGMQKQKKTRYPEDIYTAIARTRTLWKASGVRARSSQAHSTAGAHTECHVLSPRRTQSPASWCTRGPPPHMYPPAHPVFLRLRWCEGRRRGACDRHK